jgi:hypothetical protein
MSAPGFRVTYDRSSDVLYVARRSGIPARSHEGDPGLIWRYDTVSGDLIGLTIVDFERYWGGRREQLIGQISRRFGVSLREAEALVADAAVT